MWSPIVAISSTTGAPSGPKKEVTIDGGAVEGGQHGEEEGQARCAATDARKMREPMRGR